MLRVLLVGMLLLPFAGCTTKEPIYWAEPNRELLARGEAGDLEAMLELAGHYSFLPEGAAWERAAGQAGSLEATLRFVARCTGRDSSSRMVGRWGWMTGDVDSRASCLRLLRPHARDGDLVAMRTLGWLLTDLGFSGEGGWPSRGRRPIPFSKLAEGRDWLRKVASRTGDPQDLVALAVALYEEQAEERQALLLRAAELSHTTAQLLLAEDADADPAVREHWYRRALNTSSPPSGWLGSSKAQPADQWRVRSSLDSFLEEHPHRVLPSDEAADRHCSRAPTEDLWYRDSQAILSLIPVPGGRRKPLSQAATDLTRGDPIAACARVRAHLRRVPGDPAAHTVVALALLRRLLEDSSTSGWLWTLAERHLEFARTCTTQPDPVTLLTSAVLELIQLRALANPTSWVGSGDRVGAMRTVADRARALLRQLPDESPHSSRAAAIDKAITGVFNSL